MGRSDDDSLDHGMLANEPPPDPRGSSDILIGYLLALALAALAWLLKMSI